MRKTNEQNLGDVIRQWLKQSNMEEKITEVKINASWGKVMGNDIQRLTERLVYRKKVLTVYLRSAPLREELSMAKTKIVQMLNKEAGAHVVDEIIFR